MIIIDLDSDLVDRLLESFVSHWRLLATYTIGPKSIWNYIWNLIPSSIFLINSVCIRLFYQFFKLLNDPSENIQSIEECTLESKLKLLRPQWVEVMSEEALHFIFSMKLFFNTMQYSTYILTYHKNLVKTQLNQNFNKNKYIRVLLHKKIHPIVKVNKLI